MADIVAHDVRARMTLCMIVGISEKTVVGFLQKNGAGDFRVVPNSVPQIFQTLSHSG